MTHGPTDHIERGWWQRGMYVAGVDEAGRGALAGPVVAAAVVLHFHTCIPGVDDSKRLRPVVRQAVAASIVARAAAHVTAFVWQDRIDDVNILQATFDAMHSAIDGLTVDVAHLLIDGNRFRQHRIPHSCIVRGDASNVSIAAASILAKVARDTWMASVAHEQYPMYGFDKHKGYGTDAHREAIRLYGPCELHRRTFLRTP
jgi:ribonuclease HII